MHSDHCGKMSYTRACTHTRARTRGEDVHAVVATVFAIFKKICRQGVREID